MITTPSWWDAEIEARWQALTPGQRDRVLDEYAERSVSSLVRRTTPAEPEPEPEPVPELDPLRVPLIERIDIDTETYAQWNGCTPEMLEKVEGSVACPAGLSGLTLWEFEHLTAEQVSRLDGLSYMRYYEAWLNARGLDPLPHSKFMRSEIQQKDQAG